MDLRKHSPPRRSVSPHHKKSKHRYNEQEDRGAHYYRGRKGLGRNEDSYHARSNYRRGRSRSWSENSEHYRRGRRHDSYDRPKHRGRFLHFPQWRNQNRRYASRSHGDTVENYKKYVRNHVTFVESRFFEDHHHQEWFKQRYRFEYLIKQREQRKKIVNKGFQSLKQQLADIEEAEEDETVTDLSTVFPDLDCTEELSRYVASKKSHQAELEEEPAVIGETFQRKTIVFVPKVHPDISKELLSARLSVLLQGEKEVDDHATDAPAKTAAEESPEELTEATEGEQTEAAENSADETPVEATSEEAPAEATLDEAPVTENSPSTPFVIQFNDPCSLPANIKNEVFDRTAWILFEDPEMAEKLVSMQHITIPNPRSAGVEDDKERRGHMRMDRVQTYSLKVLPQKLLVNRLLNLSLSAPERIRFDLREAEALATLMDKQENLTGEEGEEGEAADTGVQLILQHACIQSYITAKTNEAELFLEKISDSDLLGKIGANRTEVLEKVRSFLQDKRKLDVILTYLRKVHLVCYYSGTQFRDKGDMFSDSIVPPVRSIPAAETVLTQLLKESSSETNGTRLWTNNFLKHLDTRIQSILTIADEKEIKKRQEQRDLDKERSEKLKAEKVDQFCKQNTKQEAENKFRCLLPPRKLFRGEKFVKKHILAKHDDVIIQEEEKASLALMREIYTRDQNKPIKSEEDFLQRGLYPYLDHTEDTFPKTNPSFLADGFGARSRYPPFKDPNLPLYGDVGFDKMNPRYTADSGSSQPEVVVEIPAAKARTVVDYSDL